MLARAPSDLPTSGRAGPSTTAVLLNLLGFQLGWFACVLGAAHGVPWLGPLVAVPVLAGHLAVATRPGRAALLLGAAALAGLGLDSLLIRAERIVFAQGILLDGFAPYWMVCLWALFASTFNVSLRWLRAKPVLAAAFGALGGPLAYWAGARLGAATLLEPAWAGFLLVGLVYAVATPVLLLLARELDGFTTGERRA